MKECCSSCDYCKYDSTYVKPYQCRRERPYKRMEEKEAFDNWCKEWRHGDLRTNCNFGVELAEVFKEKK